MDILIGPYGFEGWVILDVIFGNGDVTKGVK